MALLNTAASACEIGAHRTEPPNDIVISELPGRDVVRATVVDPIGRSLPSDELRWYDEKGGEIARGADIRRGPGRGGVATVRQIAQGIVGTEGYALLDSTGDGGRACGRRPSGTAAAEILRRARFQQPGIGE